MQRTGWWPPGDLGEDEVAATEVECRAGLSEMFWK